MAIIGFVKDRFDAYRTLMEENMYRTLMEENMHFTFTGNIQDQSSSSPLSGPMENLNETTGLIVSQLKAEKLDVFDSKRMKENRLSTSNQSIPLQTIQHTLAGGVGVPDFFKTSSEDEIESILPSQSINANYLDMIDTKMFGLSCLEEELLAYSLSSGDNVELFGESVSGVDPHYAGDMAAQLVGDDHIYDGSYKGMDGFYSFSEDCELHKALGPSFQKRTYEHLWDSSYSREDPCVKSSMFYNKDLMDFIEPSWFTGGSDAEDMLEAVVANLCSISDDALSSPSDSVRSCITRQSTFFQPKVQSKADCGVGNHSVKQNLAASPILAKVDSSASLDGMTSTLTDEGKQVKGHGRTQSGKGKKSTNVKTSRTKNGNNQRPRPRDRQLIQDRVKELRELVPNGAKCSIDGLLDHTIKHMLYLRSVTDQAEKLKGYPHQEVASCKNRKAPERNDGLQNGTSWAFEFGSELQACPIIVKDIEQPGQMLIEVLCDDHGLFLEIAQLIRRLDLAILNGMMEKRSGNSWAHFVVEAAKGFHRMEVFLPLLHLLQHAKNRISSKI
ncbi:Myc-type, basic helix-loop-helix (bHLH) domain containing protein [Trema orientale]|uniref:Myc-type, basic helix-loop-helix (BHLH) domain containing protein n=1 Tax=Trema orientale TaxID=63057 RepID=A0A2P5EZ56_TREOI|nr:Myc-type, basic helix-loop-helix (bHLH) domain containing protein [Trema orientale]